MRVLVTGHRGYIGTRLAPMLLAAGHDVVGCDTDWYKQSTFGSSNHISEVPQITKDIRDIEEDDLEGIDAIVHLAGLSNDPLGDLNPVLTYEINHRASVRLAKGAKRAGVKRFVFSSSCSYYGAAGEKIVNEDAASNPLTPYGRSKVLAEEEISALADSAFCPTFLRNATAYGVSPRLRFDLVLNNLVAWAFTTGRVLLKSDGTAWRPLVHIEDISRAFVAVLDSPREQVHNQTFNVVPVGENYRVRQIADIVAETVPGSCVELSEGAQTDARCYRVDGRKISDVLPAFKPAWNVRKGAEELYNAYKETGLLLDEFEGPRYKRVAHIKQLLDSGGLDESLRWSSVSSE